MQYLIGLHDRWLSSGVVFFVGLNQLPMGDMGVDLGSREVAVPQQHLHHAQIRAMVEQMRGEGMTQ